MLPPFTAVTSKGRCSILVLSDLFPLSSCVCWARRTGRSLLLAQQHPFRGVFSPSARLATGREKVLQGPACRGGGGPCRACCGLYLPSLPPAGGRSQPHWGQTGHSSTGQRLLVSNCPEHRSRHPPPRDPSSLEIHQTTMPPLAGGRLLLQAQSLQEEKIKGLSIRLTQTSLLAAPGR